MRTNALALVLMFLALGCSGESPPASETVTTTQALTYTPWNNSDCVLYGYAKTELKTGYWQDCSLDNGWTSGLRRDVTIWFNCRKSNQEVHGRGYRWSQCLNGRQHESAGRAYQVSSWCVLTNGACVINASGLANAPISVDPNSPEGLLLRSVFTRMQTVRDRVMGEGGPNLEDRLMLVEAADLFAALADVGFKEAAPVEAAGAISAAHRLLDVASDFTPGVSLVKDAAIVLTGRNPITGEMVSDVERAFVLATLAVPSFASGGAKGLVKTATHLSQLGETTRSAANVARDLNDVVRRSDVELVDYAAGVPCLTSSAAPGVGVVSGGLSRVAQASCVRAIGSVTAEVLTRAHENLEKLKKGVVGFGVAPRLDYSKTYRQHYAQYNDQIGQVHHAVEQQVLQRYPGVITEAELHSLENLRGIPTGQAGIDLHQKELRTAWDDFYATMMMQGRNPTKTELLQFAKTLDNKFGKLFVPPIR
jgi:hypothetical protein